MLAIRDHRSTAGGWPSGVAELGFLRISGVRLPRGTHMSGNFHVPDRFGLRGPRELTRTRAEACLSIYFPLVDLPSGLTESEPICIASSVRAILRSSIFSAAAYSHTLPPVLIC